jgi:hypothetical protein
MPRAASPARHFTEGKCASAVWRVALSRRRALGPGDYPETRRGRSHPMEVRPAGRGWGDGGTAIGSGERRKSWAPDPSGTWGEVMGHLSAVLLGSTLGCQASQHTSLSHLNDESLSDCAPPQLNLLWYRASPLRSSLLFTNSRELIAFSSQRFSGSVRRGSG